MHWLHFSDLAAVSIFYIYTVHGGNAGSYPPVLGADDQQAALSEGTEGNTLTALTVDGFGLFFKHRVQVLNTHTHKLEHELTHISIFEADIWHISL